MGARRCVVPFEQMKQQYGLENEFEITWLRSRKIFKRYDFAISSLRPCIRLEGGIDLFLAAASCLGRVGFFKETGSFGNA